MGKPPFSGRLFRFSKKKVSEPQERTINRYMDKDIINSRLVVAGFDPPSVLSFGFFIIAVNEDGYGELAGYGVELVPEETGARLLHIQDFTIDLVERFGVNAMCFEMARGQGRTDVRERLGENTGVIKLVGASYGMPIHAMPTNHMTKVFTGNGSNRKPKPGELSKKARTMKAARDLFFPGMTLKQISVREDTGANNAEHIFDAAGFSVVYALDAGYSVRGPGGILRPNSEGILEPLQ